MKKALFFIAMFIVSLGYGQKGSVLVAGDISYTSTKDKVGDTNSESDAISFNPKVGYQFSGNWTAGISGEISSTKSESVTPAFLFFNSSTEDKTFGYAVGPFVRYSKPLSEIFSFYADLSAGFQGGKTTSTSFNGLTATETEAKFTGFYTNLTPALFVNIKKNFGINFSIGGLAYEKTNADTDGDSSSAFQFNFGRSFSIGIQKNF